MNVRRILGERVRQCRMGLGMNQTTFADKVGIPVPTLSSIEHGRQSIYVERVVQLARTLAVSTDYLLGLTDSPQPYAVTALQNTMPYEDASKTQPKPTAKRSRNVAPVDSERGTPA